MKSALRFAIKAVLPILIILLGVGIREALVMTRPQPERSVPSNAATLVEVQVARAGPQHIVLQAQGTVVPARRVVLVPQVGGRVLWRSPDLVPGGRISQGDPLVRIDPRDYRVAVDQRNADLQRARLESELERGRQVVARREWQLFEGTEASATEEGRALALRQPQVETARVGVAAAHSGVRRARLDLRRTTLHAPFDAFVQSASVDTGQVVGAQSQLATLIGSHRFWVQVSVPFDELRQVDVPGINATAGAHARVWQGMGDGRIERDGQVVRLLGDLDPVGRMARVLVEIDDPLGLTPEDGRRDLPLLIGAYVHVEIDGHREEALIAVPRVALREGNQVWVMDSHDRLDVRDVSVAWRRERSVLVRSGLAPGDRIVTSRISPAVAGMALRVAEPDAAPRADRRAEAP